MGVFDEYRTYIASSTQQLVEDTPDYIRQSLLNSILAGRDIVPDILDSTLNCFAIKSVDKMFAYAKNEYTNGLPEGSKGWAPAPYDVIESVLAKEFSSLVAQGKTLKVKFASLGSLNDNFISIERLVQDPRFDRWTDNPDFIFKSFYWKTGAGFPYPDRIRAIQYGKVYSPDVPIELRLKYVRPDGATRYETVEYYDYHEPLFKEPANDRKQIYYSVEYQVFNSDGSLYKTRQWPTGTRYWSYYPKSKRYPELNLEEDSGVVPSGTFYFPVVPLRVNNVSLTGSKYHNTPLYKTSKKLLNYLEVDIQELHEGVNNSPDIASVDHAYVVFGVDIHTKSDAGINYLFEYFEDEYARSSVNESKYLNWFGSPRFTHPPLNIQNIKDGTYNITLSYSYIKIYDTNGVLGNTGSVDSRITIYDKNPQTSHPPGWQRMQYEDHRNVLYLRKQESPTVYRTIEVHGLCLGNNIHGSGKSYWTGMWGAVNLAGGEQKDAPMVIPLNVAIAREDLSIRHANAVYYESLHVVFNSFEVAKLKWYETGFFQFVTQVVMVAITVVTGGLNTLINSLTVAISAGVIATGIFIAKLILTSVLAGALFSFAAEELGVEWAAIIAAIAMVYGVVGSDSMANLPFADDMLFIGTQLSKAGSQYLQEEAFKVYEEIAEVSAEYEERQEELDKVNERFNIINQLDPLGLYTEIGMTPIDTPRTYIDRSLMVNPGLQSIQAVGDFVENSLTLPIKM